MRKSILIAGGTGLVGSRLLELLDYDQYEVKILTRRPKPGTQNVSYYAWDFGAMTIDDEAVNADYIINLTGAGIADKRWTDERKRILISSRVDSAQLIANALQKTGHRPKAYLSASAIGYYGDRDDQRLDESSDPGKGFMAECCIQWEKAAELVTPFVDRVIVNRIGIVLSTKGGALPKILMTKAVGVYNYFGNGQQYYSWIHIDDMCKIFLDGIAKPEMQGIYNAVAPLPLTNKAFTQQIKNALGGIAALPAPKFGLRLLLGEMADVVLNSNRVIPQKLTSESFAYAYPELGSAVQDLVDRRV